MDYSAIGKKHDQGNQKIYLHKDDKAERDREKVVFTAWCVLIPMAIENLYAHFYHVICVVNYCETEETVPWWMNKNNNNNLSTHTHTHWNKNKRNSMKALEMITIWMCMAYTTFLRKQWISCVFIYLFIYLFVVWCVFRWNSISMISDWWVVYVCFVYSLVRWARARARAFLFIFIWCDGITCTHIDSVFEWISVRQSMTK